MTMVETVACWIGVGLFGAVSIGLITLIVLAIILLIKEIKDW